MTSDLSLDELQSVVDGASGGGLKLRDPHGSPTSGSITDRHRDTGPAEFSWRAMLRTSIAQWGRRE
jgi:hypothetical protein